MFCNNCGKSIPDGSKYCNFCGCEQALTPQNTKNALEVDDGEDTSSSFFIKLAFGIAISALIIIFLALAISDSIEDDRGNSNGSSNQSTTQDDTRDARTSDLLVSFKKNDNFFEHDEYYMIIQAQETIENLVLKIDYKASNGTTVKTKTINIGKVVPGNQYRYELDQSGIDWDYLDKVSRFSYSIVSGTVKE